VSGPQQDIASLGLRVDSSQVVKASDNLDDFTKSAERAESATQDVAQASETAAKAVDRSANSVVNAAARIAGVDPRLRGAAVAFQRLGLGAGSVIGLTAAAAAVGLLTKAYFEGARETQKFELAIASTGNAAGLTVDQLRGMAEQLDAIGGTRGKAADSLAEFAATGKVGAENLLRFTAVAQGLERAVGIPVANTAKQFAALADEPTKAAAELQKSFNFLTPAVYDYIRAQEKSGDIAGAATTAQNAYAAALEKQRVEFAAGAPLIVRGWNAIKDAGKEAWDAMLGVGREQTIAAQISELQNARDRAIGRGFPTAGLEDQIDSLQRLQEEQEKGAKNAAAAKAATDAYVQSQQEAARHADEFIEAQKRINAAWTAFDVSAVQRDLRKVSAEYEAFGDELEAKRKANLVDDEHFFRARRDLIQKSADAEIAALRKANAALTNQDDLSSVERIAAQNKQAENTARIAEIRIRTASQLRVVNTEEQEQLRATAAAYQDAQVSADRYVDTLIRRFRIENEGLGLGEKERQRLRERSELEQRFEDRRQSLERDRRRGDITEEQFKRFLKIEQDALAKSEDAYDKYYADLQAKQGDWLVGVEEGLNNFVDKSNNIAGQIADAIEGGFDRAADAIATFATTGKGKFSDLVNSIIADLVRVEARILLSKALTSLFSGLGAGAGSTSSGTLSNTPGDPGFQGPVRARAGGGPVDTGSPYLVGEQGPELIVPRNPGWVIPHGEAGGQSVTIHQTNYYSSGVTAAQIEQMNKVNRAQTVNEVAQNIRRGRWKWARQA
jgi:lambda family phage tail tape measure protein